MFSSHISACEDLVKLDFLLRGILYLRFMFNESSVVLSKCLFLLIFLLCKLLFAVYVQLYLNFHLI
jgi:hypothetical protein